MNIKVIKKDKYILSTVIISVAVAVLIHFPESVSLFDGFESHTLFPGMKFMDVANEIMFTFLSLLLLFVINTRLFHFNQASIKITATKIILSFVITWILSNLLGQVFVFLHKTFDIPAIDAMVHHYLHPLRDFIMACLVTSSCYIIYLIRRQQQVLIENEQLQAENIRNQYEVLKNQLNPHMLFNSLNTLRSLVRENQDKAQDYIQELSRVLRYTLQSNEFQSVSLREEMEFVSAYIFLLKMRFENNLQFDIQIDKSFEDYHLPQMAVQVLVENAVKHNEISNRKPLTIHIMTDTRGSLCVSNDIQPKWTATPGTGIGLVNLTVRYRLLFKQDIQITENKEFTVCIPLIKEAQSKE
ncbi:sensor histidine kinase [uncultured Bacteroides sp.]|uniref:sensor histidine kinase n=1 Tax=uncultured Bacteroides sp. TaxID=162156 RepID=UPI0025CDECCA|nr:histidine kinase [uncultured Bacteroides sp.]